METEKIQKLNGVGGRGGLVWIMGGGAKRIFSGRGVFIAIAVVLCTGTYLFAQDVLTGGDDHILRTQTVCRAAKSIWTGFPEAHMELKCSRFKDRKRLHELTKRSVDFSENAGAKGMMNMSCTFFSYVQLILKMC